MDTARVENLEIKCAHLEKAVQELSDVVYRQQLELDRVLTRSLELQSQVEALEAAADQPAGPRAEIPPHY